MTKKKRTNYRYTLIMTYQIYETFTMLEKMQNLKKVVRPCRLFPVTAERDTSALVNDVTLWLKKVWRKQER